MLVSDTMERNTFDSTIRSFRDRTTFHPFTVALVNGDRFEVDHPEAIVVRDGVALYVGPGGVPVVFAQAKRGVQTPGFILQPTPGRRSAVTAKVPALTLRRRPLRLDLVEHGRLPVQRIRRRSRL